MDYEKKYKEALERAKSFLKRWDGIKFSADDLMTDEFKTIFPELNESEDEKIMKDLKFYLEVRRCQTNDDKEYISCNKFLSWLENQGKQKGDWSEEDELMLTSIIQTLKLTNGAAQMKIDWLKSIKPQPRWKPSEEQIKALKYVVNYFGELTEHFAEYDETKSLYNDLKSL